MPRTQALTRPIVWLLTVAVALAGLAGTGVPASADEPGQITGTVTVTGGTPLTTAHVRAYRDDGNGWRVVADDRTDRDGHYDISSLPAGAYRLGFDNVDEPYWPEYYKVYRPEYYNNASTVDTATDIAVTAGATTSGMDAELAPFEPVHITGTVRGTGDVPLGNIEVQALQYAPYDSFGPVATTHTAADGTYDLVIQSSGDRAGGYLHFNDPSGDYAPEYYNNAVSLARATGVYVPEGTTASGTDVRLELGGHITGTVTGPGGTPLAGVSVRADFTDPNDFNPFQTAFYTRTADDGSYDLSALPASTYSLDFEPGGHYWPESYPTYVVVASGTTVTRRDARLADGRLIANLKRPAITAKPKVGRRVTAKPGLWDPAAVTATYQWLVTGRPVAGATRASYKPRAADVGKTLRVRVTVTATNPTTSTRVTATATSTAKTVAKGRPRPAARR